MSLAGDDLNSAAAKPVARSGGRILRLGRNCCAIRRARRASVLVDAAAYFAALDSALRGARRSILILGWDFDASIRLRPDVPDSPPLGDFLRSLVEERPTLEVRVLVWDLSTVHAPGEALPLVIGAKWQDHPRIQLWLDHNHPVYGAQHQKLVSVDDRLAAVGGIDLTVERWDTSEHRPDAPLRVTSDGKRYEPIHDIQMLVDGEAAEAVASVMHERWRQATGEDIPLCNDASDPWPAELEPGFVDAPVAVSRTIPASGHDPAVREVRALTEDALQAARQSIYIEAQYLADGWVGDILERSLCQERGPEIVVVTPHTSKGFLEKWTMGNNRDRMIRRLRHADRFGRFRALHPVIAAPNGDCEIFIHSKLMIVDDRLLRIGSANLNRRSTGLDTECDVSIEATGEDTRLAKGIAKVRETLLAEHLGVARAVFEDAAARDGSLIRAIERLNTNVRCLRPFDHISEKGPMRLMPGTRLLDPRKPLPLLSMLRRE